MSKPVTILPDELDLQHLIRAGDYVISGQMAGEPLTLTRALAAQRESFERLNLFLGVQHTTTFGAEMGGRIRFASFGAMDQTGRLARPGLLDLIPMSLCDVSRAIDTGALGCDVLLIQLSPSSDGQGWSFGVANDYLAPAMRRARVVIAELNDQAPWTYGDALVAPADVDYVVPTSRPVVSPRSRPPGVVEAAIAQHVAEFIKDRSTLQIGIGSVPEAVLARLEGHKDLGWHSGMLSDGAAKLIASGAITGRHKPMDQGLAVAALVSGSADLYQFIDRNPAIRICGSHYTNSAAVIRRMPNFVAVNSALEVDLFGAANSESANGRMIGGIGGLPDFVRGALSADGGRSIIALPSTTPDGRQSRIVARLNGPSTLGRSDADVIVTEFGSAELRYQPLAERMLRLIAIAHPAFRDALEKEARSAHSDAARAAQF